MTRIAHWHLPRDVCVMAKSVCVCVCLRCVCVMGVCVCVCCACVCALSKQHTVCVQTADSFIIHG